MEKIELNKFSVSVKTRIAAFDYWTPMGSKQWKCDAEKISPVVMNLLNELASYHLEGLELNKLDLLVRRIMVVGVQFRIKDFQMQAQILGQLTVTKTMSMTRIDTPWYGFPLEGQEDEETPIGSTAPLWPEKARAALLTFREKTEAMIAREETRQNKQLDLFYK